MNLLKKQLNQKLLKRLLPRLAIEVRISADFALLNKQFLPTASKAIKYKKQYWGSHCTNLTILKKISFNRKNFYSFNT